MDRNNPAIAGVAETLLKHRPQEVRSYNPTWRDQIAKVLMNVLPEKSVEGFMGSRGIGMTDKNMGMGLVDMTPLGAPLWLNEAERSRQSGDMGGQMLNTIAAVPIPGAKVAAGLVDDGVEAVQKGIRAYHGSPHDFDRFSMDKIGTGEGAQAYGHGLYFAENEGVARSYRDSLTATHPDFGVINGKRVAELQNDVSPESFALRRVSRQIGQGWRPNEAPDKAIDEVSAALSELDTEIARYDLTGPPRHLAQERENLADELQALQSVKKQGVTYSEPPPGRMYETRINASPDEFLDWDKPLSEQPESVRHALDNIDNPMFAAWKKSGAWPHVKGETLYRELAGGLTNKAHAEGKHTAATELTRAAGIKGIRYKDAGSRYTPADLPDNPIANEARRFLAEAGGDSEAALKAFRASNPVERWATTEREEVSKVIEAAGRKPTSNFVVFDDSIIEILRKYGIAGLIGGGSAAGAMTAGPGKAEASTK